MSEKEKQSTIDQPSAALAEDIVMPRKEAPTFTAKEWILALAAVAIAFIGLKSTLWGSGFGFGVTLSAVLLTAVSYVYLRQTGVKPCRASYFYLALTVAAAALYSVNGAHGVMILLRFPLLIALYGYWLCAASSTRSTRDLSPTAVYDVCHAMIVAPLGGMGGALRGMTSGLRGKKNLPFLMIGVVISIPLLIVVIALLSSADQAFADAIGAVTGWFTLGIGDAIFRVLLTAFAALLLLSQWLRVIRDKSGAVKRQAPHRFIPFVVPCVVISLLCVVYIVFFAAQATSISKVIGAQQENFSYSHFAREGFFQLCVVCGINFGVVLIANYLTDDRRKALRVLISLLGVSTLLLTASALFKMFLYIAAYGLTPLRIVTSWFMLILALAFSAIVVSQWRQNVPVFKISALSLCVSFIALCFLNPAKWSADYNADAYLRGALDKFDYEAFSYDAPYAADAVYRVYEQTDDDTLKSALALRFGDQGVLFTDPLMLNLNIEKLHAAKVYQALGEKQQAFMLNVVNRASLPVYGVRAEYFLGDTPLGNCVTVNADESPLASNDRVSFDLISQDFPENADISTFRAQFYVIGEDGKETAAGEPIALSAVYGREYSIALNDDEQGACTATLLNNSDR